MKMQHQSRWSIFWSLIQRTSNGHIRRLPPFTLPDSALAAMISSGTELDDARDPVQSIAHRIILFKLHTNYMVIGLQPQPRSSWYGKFCSHVREAVVLQLPKRPKDLARFWIDIKPPEINFQLRHLEPVPKTMYCWTFEPWVVLHKLLHCMCCIAVRGRNVPNNHSLIFIDY